MYEASLGRMRCDQPMVFHWQCDKHQPLYSVVCSQSQFEEPAWNLFDRDLANIGNMNQNVNPWYVFMLGSPISDIQAVRLMPRTDAFWFEISNVTVSLSNVGLVGDTAARICGAQVSAKESDKGKGVIVPCLGGGAWQYVIVQRFSNGQPVNFGMAEVSVMRGGGESTLDRPPCTAHRIIMNGGEGGE